jgi:selenocysteine lyase/cysteine desulfurase
MSLVLNDCRALFALPAEVSYLNCAYMSPLMSESTRAGEAGILAESQPSAVTSNDFFERSERLRVLFAELISATADDIAIVPSASYALSTAAANIALESGDEILVLDEQFPSNVYPWRVRA